MIKPLNKMSIEGKYLNVIEAIYEKPTANLLKSKKLKAFPLRLGTIQRCPLSALLFTTVSEFLAMATRQHK